MKEKSAWRTNPKVSIIIPCYNHGIFIEDAINSVKKQTYKNFEIIILDDGSDDVKTINKLVEIEKINPDIIIIRQENRGLANARNSGIRLAKGEYILPLDADDMIHPEMLEKCVKILQKHPQIGFVYTQTKLFGKKNEIWTSKEFDLKELLKGNYITASSLIRKVVWKKSGGYDDTMKKGYEDWEFYIRLASIGVLGKLIKEVLFFYRKHGKSLIDIANQNQKETKFYIMKKHSDLYLEFLSSNYEKTNKKLKEKTNELEKLKQIIQEKDSTIAHMQTSKFWKLRDIWHKLKWGFKNPRMFYKNYSNKILKKVFKVFTAPFKSTKS